MIDRRFILLGSSAFIVVSCSQSGPRGVARGGSSGCLGIADQLEQSLCQQQEIAYSTVTYVTVGMVVGAAIGGGIGFALGGNPAVGALIGAGIGATAALAERYWAYKLETAKQDQLRAIADVKRDIQFDIERANSVINSIKIANQETIKALENKNNELLRNYRRLQKTVQLVSLSQNNKEVIQKTEKTYKDVIEITPVKYDPVAIDLVNKFQSVTVAADVEIKKALEARRLDEQTRNKFIQQ